MISIGDLLCYACFCPFLIFFDSFLRFDFFLRQLFLKFVRRCFGRLDGSIRALRKVRFRNEIDNFIESMSQMVPRWSPEVPKTDNLTLLLRPHGPICKRFPRDFIEFDGKTTPDAEQNVAMVLIKLLPNAFQLKSIKIN